MAQYQITLEGRTTSPIGEATRNVWFYDTSTLVASFDESIALELAFEQQVFPAIKAITSTTQVYLAIKVYELFQRQFFKEQFFVPAQVGGRAGDLNPPFVAWGFRHIRQRGDMKNGYKRFAGVAETDVVGGAATAAAIVLLNALATAMNAVLTYTVAGNPESASGVIVKRVPVVVNGQIVSYRLPASIAEYVFYSATAWQYQWVTTQNTRKVGRGI